MVGQLDLGACRTRSCILRTVPRARMALGVLGTRDGVGGLRLVGHHAGMAKGVAVGQEVRGTAGAIRRSISGAPLAVSGWHQVARCVVRAEYGAALRPPARI